jgi:actin-like ATPase involved in cell morphogenesis
VSYWLGIDVGTTFTAAAICREETGRRVLPEVVPLGTRSTAVSSVVYLAEDGQVVVGEAAERRAHTHPERVVREFKRRIGDEIPMLIGGVPHSAPEIAAMVVRWVVERVAEREGGAAAGIVITHPASWGEYKIQLMAEALRVSGVPEATFRTEPEAAAASYALQERIGTGSTIAVYDLGGGTFDAAVVTKTGPTTFSVLGQPQGIDHLGGADFDDAVFGHVSAAVPALSALDPDDPATLTATAALRRECTEAKEALSADTEVTIPVLTPEIRSQVRLVRTEFEDMIRPSLAETLQALRRALRSADLTPQDLDAVLLVGGSSRVPLVAQLVSAELGRPVATDADPKAAIALGAALSALPADTIAPDTVKMDLATDTPVQDDTPDGSPRPLTGADLPVLAHSEEPARPSLSGIPLDGELTGHQQRRARTRRVTQFVLAGLLALFTAAGAVSVPYLSSRSGPIPPANAGTPAPEVPPAPSGAGPAVNAPAANAPVGRAPAANAPAANAGSNDGGSSSGRSGGVVRTTPAAEPNTPAGGPGKPGVGPATSSAPASTWSTRWTTSRTQPPHSTSTEPMTPTTMAPTTSATTKAPPPMATTTAPPATTTSSPPP